MMQPLHEQYRPTCFDDVAGQDKAVRTIQTLAKRGLTGRAFWLAGQSGTGKTTLARIIASEVADACCIEEVDAGALNAETLRRIDRASRLYGMGEKSGRAFIVNEAHGLSKAAVRTLLVMLEPIPPH